MPLRTDPATIYPDDWRQRTYAPVSHRHEVSIGVGIWSDVQLMQGVVAGKEAYDRTPINTYSGTYSFTYRYAVNREFSMGAAMAFENETGDWYERGGGYPSLRKKGIFKRNVWTAAVSFRIHYAPDNDVTQPYGYLDLGYTYQNEVATYETDYYGQHYYNGVNSLGNNREVSNDRTHFNIQICPLGVSFGRKYCFFGELGFGYKGIFNGGFKLKL
ncbi:MAG: hypothetical protein V4649_08365 [Bacteroidota bacterium]